MTEDELAKIVMDISFEIHRELGPGLFESVYEKIIAYELKCRNISFTCQQTIPVLWKGVDMDLGFRTDLILENKLIVEIKSVEALAPVHKKQLLTYLKITKLKLGLLLNFNHELMKEGIKRVANKMEF